MRPIKDMFKEAEAGITNAPIEEGNLWTAGIDFPGRGHAIEIHETTKELAEELRDKVIVLLKLDSINKDDWQIKYLAKQAAGIKFEWFEERLNKWQPSIPGGWGFADKKEHYREVPNHKRLTAIIVRKWCNWNKAYNWEFTGTPEMYRAECEKYGYSVISEIKEYKELMTPKEIK